MRDEKKNGTYQGGERDDICDHGLSRRSLRVKAFHELGWKVKVAIKQEHYMYTRTIENQKNIPGRYTSISNRLSTI